MIIVFKPEKRKRPLYGKLRTIPTVYLWNQSQILHGLRAVWPELFAEIDQVKYASTN